MREAGWPETEGARVRARARGRAWEEHSSGGTHFKEIFSTRSSTAAAEATKQQQGQWAPGICNLIATCVEVSC